MRQPSSWILNFSTISLHDFVPYWHFNFQKSFVNLNTNFWNKNPQGVKISQKFQIPLSHFTEFEEIFNINFIRKEKTYTKLKYSRTPAYDIVSGGVAALFAGFLGFLICEKFGFELIDSADFFFALMYVIVLLFPIRMLFKLTRDNDGSSSVCAFKKIFEFFWLAINVIFKNKNK